MNIWLEKVKGHPVIKSHIFEELSFKESAQYIMLKEKTRYIFLMKYAFNFLSAHIKIRYLKKKKTAINTLGDKPKDTLYLALSILVHFLDFLQWINYFYDQKNVIYTGYLKTRELNGRKKIYLKKNLNNPYSSKKHRTLCKLLKWISLTCLR